MVKKQLSKPQNWQDFEDLCKKLWGEIWSCPEIKKNGRAGQSQNGIDIYGIPKDESMHFGIQCKCKDEYSNSKITINEIEQEIESALSFTPQLKKLYIATTSNKDSAIEQYMREVDAKSRNNGSFEIHIYAWEDIVDLIFANRNTYNWYINKSNFSENPNVNVSLYNGGSVLEYHPVFVNEQISYTNVKELTEIKNSKFTKSERMRMEAQLNSLVDKILRYEKALTNSLEYDTDKLLSPQPIIYRMKILGYDKLKNLGSCTFRIKIENTGTNTIQDFKMYINFQNVISIDSVDKRQEALDNFNYEYNVLQSKTSPNQLVFSPCEAVLVEGDSIITDEICFRPEPKVYEAKIKWKFLSRGYSNEGSFTIKIKPKFVEDKFTFHVENPDEKHPINRIVNKYEHFE